MKKWLYLAQGVLGAFVFAVLISRGAPPRSIAITLVASIVGFVMYAERRESVSYEAVEGEAIWRRRRAADEHRCKVAWYEAYLEAFREHRPLTWIDVLPDDNREQRREDVDRHHHS